MAHEKTHHLFDILGPIMVGPSSSHTAGACRLAHTARRIYGGPLSKITFELHGSFAHTYKGHGSDRALAGGILGYPPSDERLVHALETAAEEGIELIFQPADLGAVHPNTVRIKFATPEDAVFSVTGASIGGGAIVITDIDGTETNFSGDYPTLILRYIDHHGMVYAASEILYKHLLNIATMQVSRRDETATMIIELDDPFDEAVIQSFKSLPRLDFFKAIEK